MPATLTTLRVGETIQVVARPLNQDGQQTYAGTDTWSTTRYDTTTTVTAPSVTPPVNGCMILLIGHAADDGTAGVFSGGEPPVERLDDNTSLGNDAGIFVDTFVQAVAAATGARTSTYSTFGSHMGATVALKPSGSPSFVAVGTVAKVAGGNMVPGEPAGAASGDILICVVEQRDNVVSTMASPWVRLYGINRIETVSPTTARASAFWMKRGAGAPDYTVTRAGGDAGIAAVLAFRNCDPLPIVGVATETTALVEDDVVGDLKAKVTGQFPGSDLIVWGYDTHPAIAMVQQQTKVVTVIDVDRIGFKPASAIFDLLEIGSASTMIVVASGLDSRDDEFGTAPILTEILWTLTGGGSSPITINGGTTLADTLVATLAVKASITPGNDTIVVTAKNSKGQVVTGTLSVRVLGVVSAVVEIA